MAAVPSIGRATRIERPVARGADAAGDLYERYSAQIFGYCLHQLGSREEAEDAVQTTFMNAFRGLSRGIVPEVESAWLFKIAHNVCLSRRRSSWRRGRVEAPNNFEVLQEIVPGRESASDELIRLQDVLEEMPENQRRAILLREWQGLTYREISAELGLSQAAVETLIFRARRSLAQGLEQYDESAHRHDGHHLGASTPRRVPTGAEQPRAGGHLCRTGDSYCDRRGSAGAYASGRTSAKSRRRARSHLRRKPAAPAPAPTTAPAPEKCKSKGKKEKPAKPTHGAKAQPAPPAPAPEPAEAALEPTDAAWGEPDADPEPTPPSQESKPDKGPEADEPEKDHGHGNDKN